MAIVINGSTGITATESSNLLGNGVVEAADLASGAAVSNIGYTPANQSNVMGRNIIVNGAMQIAQRATSATGITSNGYHTVDRWYTLFPSTGLSHKAEKAADGPDGFASSLKITATTQYSSPAAGDALLYDTRFEGQNVQHLKNGTSSAEQVTLSFWVKSSVTGSFAVMLRDQDNSRTTSKLYTINSADTWEYKTITYAADTGGSGFDNDNALSLRVAFFLCAGSNYTSGTLATTWESNVNANQAVGSTNLLATLNATWQITGVQLEVGSVATEFERRPYGVELMLAQRYYYKMKSTVVSEVFALGMNQSSTVHQSIIVFPVTMRTRPTALEQSGNASDYAVRQLTSTTGCSSVPTYEMASTYTARTAFFVGSGLNAGQGSYSQSDTTNAFLAWSAEL